MKIVLLKTTKEWKIIIIYKIKQNVNFLEYSLNILGLTVIEKYVTYFSRLLYSIGSFEQKPYFS